jgi:hypothetical protein
MKLLRDRKHAEQAARRVLARRQEYRLDSAGLRQFAERHRTALLTGGGFLAGMLLGRIETTAAARKLGAALSALTLLARSSLGHLLLAGGVGRATRLQRRDPDRRAD